MQDAHRDDDTVQHRFARLAAGQHAAASVAQASGIGLTRRQVRWALATGRLRMLRPGVVAPAGAPATWEQAVMAAVLAGRDGAVASHATAAVIWGLDAPGGDAIEISDVRVRQHRLDGIRAHRSVVLEPDRTRHRGIPVTSVARTVVDLSGRLHDGALGRLLDDALRRDLVTLERVAECAARLAPAPGRRLRLVRRVLEARGAGFEPGDSAFESRVVRALAAGGLPAPVVAHPVHIGGRRYRIDLAYPAQRVAIELDGWDTHRTRGAFDADRARGNDLVTDGWVLLRFTWRMSDAQIVAAVRAALGRARGAA